MPLDKSNDGGWGAMSQPVGGNKVHVIGEESSGIEYTSGGQGLLQNRDQAARKKRKQKVPSKKTFAEPPLGRPPAG